jgi:hypothetical protein
MKHNNRFHLLILASVLVTVAAWAHVAQAAPAEPGVPSAIAVPAGNKLFLVGRATGVQIYACTAAPDGYAWSFVAPRASLYGDNGKLITTHFAGPTWQARDGSAVVARVVDRAPVDGAIPWLLLEAASTSVGADGDRLARTTYVQRVATTGGLSPAAGACSAATAGTTAEIPYTADYYFWKEAGR